MSPPLVRVSSLDVAGRAVLEDDLRRVGISVARDAIDEAPDVLVYLDREHGSCGIADVAADGWIPATVEPLAHAISSSRDFLAVSGERARMAVVVTSTDGAIGPAFRSISAAVSAGLRGLLMSVMHEAPWLSGVLLVHPSPWFDARGAPDVAGGTRSGLDRRDALRWAASEIARISDDRSTARPGHLVTVSIDPVV